MHVTVSFEEETDLSIGVDYNDTTDMIVLDLMDDHDRLILRLSADDWQRISAAVVRRLLAQKGLK